MDSGEAEAEARCAVGSEGGGVLDTVARISGKLAGENGGGEAVVESLRQLQAVPMTFQVLEATKVGRAVNALRKNASSSDLARELAAALLRRWKALADEHFRSSRRSQSPESSKQPTDVSDKKLAPATSPDTPKAADEKSVRCPLPIKGKPTAVAIGQHAAAVPKPAHAPSKPSVKIPSVANKPAASLANKAKKVPDAAAPPPKPSGGSSGRKRKEAPAASIDEARLAMVKRRLQERYKEAAAAKEKRRIQFISVPRGGPVVVRRREVVRCGGAAIGTVKQAPVPSSSRMFRAS